MALRKTLTVSVTPELRDFVRGCLAAGRYSSASEVVRSGLRLLIEQDEARQHTAPVRGQSIPNGRT